MTATTDVKELRESLRDENAKALEIATSLRAAKLEGKNLEIHPDAPAELRAHLANIDELKTLIGLQENESEVKAWLEAVPGSGVAGADIAERLQHRQAVQGKTLGQLYTESDVFKAYAEKGFPRGGSDTFELKAANMGAGWQPRFGEVDGEVKDIFTATAGTYTSLGFGTVQHDGPVIPAYRTQRIRDLFPNAPTAANLIEYQRRTGYTNNGRVVPERTAADGSAATGGSTDVFGLKPTSNLVWQTIQVPVRLIAHLMKASKTVLDDEPRLRSIIDSEMLYGLRLTEDAEILYGDGTGSHLTGIMNVPGIQSYDGNSGPMNDYYSDTIRRALTLVQIAYYESTGVVLNPFDWESIELEKDTQNRYVLVTNVAMGAQTMVWRNPVVSTPAMQEGQFLVGAFGLGAKLYDREQAGIAISTENEDDFARNAITMRAEERLALEVSRPESFVKGLFKH